MKQSNVEKLGPFTYSVDPTNIKEATKAQKGIGSSPIKVTRGYNTARKWAHTLMNDHGCSEVAITITRN